LCFLQVAASPDLLCPFVVFAVGSLAVEPEGATGCGVWCRVKKFCGAIE